MVELAYPIARVAGHYVEMRGEYVVCVVAERFGEARELRAVDCRVPDAVKVGERVCDEKLLEALLLWTDKDVLFEKIDESLRFNVYVIQHERLEVLKKAQDYS